MSHIVNKNKARSMEAINVEDWLDNEFTELLDRYFSSFVEEAKIGPSFRDLYSKAEIYSIALDCAMISVLEHDNYVSDYAGWGDLIDALGDEETFNMFIAEAFSSYSKGGLILAKIKERIDPAMPYVVTGRRIYYILKEGLIPVPYSKGD